MDTKWKKFDKLTIIRLVCLALSVVFAFVAALKTIGLWIYLEQNNAYGEAAAAVEEFFGGSGEEYRKSKIYDEYETFLNKALDKGLFYTSGDSKGYENYKKKSLDKYCDDLINVFCNSTVFGTDYFVFYSTDEGYISLKKIGNFPLTIDSTFYYERKAGYRVFAHSPYDCNYKFETDSFYDAGDYEEFVTTFAPTAPQVPTTQNESNGITTGPYKSALFSYYDYSDAWHEQEHNSRCVLSSGGAKYHPDIVSDNMKAVKSSKADAVVMIESAYMGDKYYSGTYEITLNRDVIAESEFEGFVDDGEGIISEDEYLEMYKSINSYLSKYKNAYFAVLDESTGKFITNVRVKNKKVTPENVERLINDTCGKNSYVFFSGRAKGWGNDFERLVCNTGTSFENKVSSDTVFTVWAGFDESLSGGIDSFSHTESAKETSDMLGYTFPPVIVCLLGWLICIIALVFLTGRKSYDDEIHMHRFDSVFTIIRTVINLGLIVFAFFLGTEFLFSNGDYYGKSDYHYEHIPVEAPGARTAALILCVISSLLLTDWILYIARHIKNRSLLKNISFVKLTMYLIRKRKERIAETERRGAEYKDFRKKILRVLVSTVSIIDIILLILLLFLSDIDGAFMLLVFPMGIAECFILRWFMRYITAVRDIFASLHKMRSGENLPPLEKGKMPLSLRAYAEDINSVNDGLKIAVENATREQRTKTELITNVSHDLKTPLTSIINYVDLLSKKNIEDEEAKEYISVLCEKSEKLKKLIADLVEASKASSGNIPVNFVKMNLHEFITQVVGEYEDDFSGRGLTVFTKEKEESIIVTADSKLSYRVMDNLMVNIKKYALSGTRVYIRLFTESGYGCIEISNISEKQLNISAEELKERFVRGDESRSGDGSGLGLSIAEDFMLLQNGKLDIMINGDMFTATVRFRIN